MKEEKLKKLFENKKKLARKDRRAGKEFDDGCAKYYGFQFHQKEWLKDNEQIIDTLDYGTSDLDFEVFDKLMKSSSFQETIELTLLTGDSK